ARLQGNKTVVTASHDDLRPQFAFDQLLEPHGDIEHQFLFAISIRSDAACVVASMSGINDNTGKLEAKASDQRPGSRSWGLGGCKGFVICVGRSVFGFDGWSA